MNTNLEDKILVVEDSDSQMAWVTLSLKKIGLAEEQIIRAKTLAEGSQLFTVHRNKLVAVLMDGCVDSGHLDSLPLSREIAISGFLGPIIAMSSDAECRRVMITNGGCTHEAPVRNKIDTVLGPLLSSEK